MCVHVCKGCKVMRKLHPHYDTFHSRAAAAYSGVVKSAKTQEGEVGIREVNKTFWPGKLCAVVSESLGIAARMYMSCLCSPTFAAFLLGKCCRLLAERE